jgi:3-oxoacyl-[acyl-carrier protein] reductase
MTIKDSNILLTGGSTGIGKSTAKMLIDKGANVIITGRNEQRLKRTADEIGAIPLHFDVSDLESIPQKAGEALSIFNGKMDVLINNAGVGVYAKMGEINEKNLDLVYRTNVYGLALLTQEIVKVFREQSYGNIINIGSTAAQKGFIGGSIYAATKFAVRGMTQTWQAELRKDNIRVMLINPSEVTTAFGNDKGEEREELPNKLGPDDVAHAIVSVLEMRDKGFIPELSIWATNPF